MTHSLFIFRRDLRVADNSALLAAAASSDQVTACFILDPVILARFEQHDLRVAFLMQSLADLDAQVAACGGSLRIFRGRAPDVVNGLIRDAGISAVYVNRDYTPYARHRDRLVRSVCEKQDVRFVAWADALLNEPEAVLKADGTPYVVFTPYHRAAARHPVAKPAYERPSNLTGTEGAGAAWQHSAPANMAEPMQPAGRSGAMAILKRLGRLDDYETSRNLPAIAGTSRLSAHLRFGTCSVREAWHHIAGQLGDGHPLLRQLYWRDFFTQVAFHHPHVFGHAFRRQYDRLSWRKDNAAFEQWCSGRTGFPIVDAAMRELVATGYMHNRARMITASFLVKNLHVDWRQGEAFFARHLIDYDPCVNNGNWQWAASTGCDAQPWFRVFNPWRQQVRFDPEAEYIKRWIPALADWPAKRIHDLEKDPTGYLPPMVDLKRSAEEIKAAFKALG